MDAAMTFRSFLARALTRLAGWMAPPLPRLGTGGIPWPTNHPRPPTLLELLAELKSTAWACEPQRRRVRQLPAPAVRAHRGGPAAGAVPDARPVGRRRTPAARHDPRHGARRGGAGAPPARPARPGQSNSQRVRPLGNDHALAGGPRRRLLAAGARPVRRA